MRTPPLLPYCGLTVILSQPSRFDKDPKTLKLLSGWAGDFFFQKLAPLPKATIDIVDCDSFKSLLLGTKLVMCLGSRANATFFPFGNNLNQQRGYPYEKDSVIYISSYAPQDAMDLQDYEGRFNADPKASGDDEDEDEDESEKSTKGRTERKNFRFWLEQDCRRVVDLLRDSNLYHNRPVCPTPNFYPNLDELICALDCLHDTDTLHVDIETEPDSFVWWCVSIGIEEAGKLTRIFTIPIFHYNYTLAYGEQQTARLFACLARNFHRMCVVCHNAMFDLFVLAWKYHIVFGRRVYDTMLSHARKYPGVEKSLGHCMSIYTFDPYHKNEGLFTPQNEQQERQLWAYNAKDVWGMYLIKHHLETTSTPGELASIKQVNDSISSYLLMSLLGIRYMPSEVNKVVKEGDERMMQMLRCIKLLVGYSLLPTSNKQMVTYFHDELGLNVVSRSRTTGKPSLGKDSLYKLYAKTAHPVIPFCIEFRKIQKETSSLLFTPWQQWK